MFFSSHHSDPPVDQSAPARREELGQREAGAAGEVQPGEGSVGAASARGRAGEGTSGCVCDGERERHDGRMLLDFSVRKDYGKVHPLPTVKNRLKL